MEHTGFRKGRGTRDHIANVRWMMKRVREIQKTVYLCSIDYSKAFDTVQHLKMLNTMKIMGIPEHLIMLVRDLYTEQEAKVQVEQDTTEGSPPKKTSKANCILSPGRFNLHNVPDKERDFVLSAIQTDCRSQWPHGLRSRSSAARLLRSWVQTSLL